MDPIAQKFPVFNKELPFYSAYHKPSQPES